MGRPDAARSRVAPGSGHPRSDPALAAAVWNETRVAERSRVAPGSGHPRSDPALAAPVWNETRVAERSRVAPGSGHPRSDPALAAPVTMIICAVPAKEPAIATQRLVAALGPTQHP